MEVKEFFLTIIKNLVDFPDDVFIEVRESDTGRYILEINVVQTDIGKVIGKDGRIFAALKTLAGVMSVKSRKTVFLEIKV